MRLSSPGWIAILLISTMMLGCSMSGYGQGGNIRVAQADEKKLGIVHRAKEDLRDTTDALSITPRVKGAIIADAQLNDRRNHINVGTKDYLLHLTGHVYSSAIKSRASSVAARKLHQMHKSYKVSNELSIVRKK